jgi:sugar O-acyltransferase (sialic acid O-acetyltransferase NeuD family)
MVLGIYGAGGLGREILDLARAIDKQNDSYENIVFIDDNANGSENQTLNGARVLTFSEFSSTTTGDSAGIVIGIGEPAIRAELAVRLEQQGYSLESLIHPMARVSEFATIGQGTVIQYNCSVACNVQIGSNVYVQPMVLIGHDDIIDSHCVISPFACVAGNVHIGDKTYIGMNVAIREGVNIGSESIVGMGSIVARDIEDCVIALGNPARAMKRNETKRVFGRI